MEEEIKKEEITPTPEEVEQEIQEEEEVIKFSKAEENEVRSEIIKKHSLDEDTDTDLIDSLTKDSLADRKRFGKLIGQKRKKREKLEKLQKPKEEIKTQPAEEEPKFVTEDDLNKRDRKRDLENLEASDALKKEVENYANLNNCSIKEAFKSDYIKFQKDAEDKKAEIEEASIGDEGGKTHTVSNTKALSDAQLFQAIKDVDKSTKDGRAKHKELKDELKRRG